MPLETHRQNLRKILSSAIGNEMALSKINDYKEVALSLNDPIHVAYAEFYKTRIYFETGEMRASKKIISQILPIFREHEKHDFIQACVLALGHIYYRAGEIEKALKYYEEATQIPTTRKQNIATSYNSLTNAFIEFKQYDKAIINIKKGIQTLSLSNLHDRPLYYNLLLNLSSVLLLKQMPEKSLEILDKVKNAQKKLPQNTIEAKLYRNYGNYYKYLNKLDRALEFYLRALKHSSDEQCKPIQLESNICIAEIYLHQNKLKEAEVILLNAHETCFQEDRNNYLKLLDLLVELYQRIGNRTKQKKFSKELGSFG